MRRLKPFGRLLVGMGLLIALGGVFSPLFATTTTYPMTCVSCNTDGSYTCSPGCENSKWCC